MLRDESTWMVGVDTGGTFTDLIAVEPRSGTFRLCKVPSVPSDPSSAVLATETRCGFGRGSWSVETIVRGDVARAGGDLMTRHSVRATEGGRTVFSRNWRKRIQV